MRRNLLVFVALAAMVGVGCSGKQNNFDQTDTGGNNTGGNGTTSGNGTTTGSTSGSTGTTGGGSLASFECPSIPGNFLYLHGDGGVDPQTGVETGNFVESGVVTLSNPNVSFLNSGLYPAPARNTFYTVYIDFASGADDFNLATDSSNMLGSALQANSTYSNATRYPFNNTGPGFDLSGDGHGCNMETADFELSHIEVMPDGGLWYAGKFKQLCENQGVPLFGCFNYQGPAPGLPEDAGAPDAGPCGDLTGATLTLENSVSPISAATDTVVPLQFLAHNAQGAAIVGCPVNFSEPNASDVPMIITPATVNTDSSGVASSSVKASLAGTATLLANMSGVQNTVDFNFVAPSDAGSQQDAGPHDPTTIAWVLTTPTNPSILGLAGSGINEQGTMTFQVTDQNSKPIPGVTVDFSEPPYVSFADGGAQYYAPLTNTTTVTDGNGKAIVSFHSGKQVGIAQITASTLNLLGNPISTSQTIPVRGAKPSAGGFNLLCEHEALPVYTTTTSTESMKCTVQLSDRFTNRVGIPTSVTFYTEAGAIDATATTAAFDANNPTAEGTATVTFTATASGTAPADVVPLANEPSTTVQVNGQNLVWNPRDRLVTIIAITTGEERFADSNNNGQYDPGEIFYDVSDPFIDANDDNTYDAVYPGGPSEQRFCSTQNPSGCGPSFSYGNGQWDSNATIWTSTHVAFTGLATPTNANASGSIPGSTPACIGATQQGQAPVFAYDDHFNLPSAGTTFTASLVGSPAGLAGQAALSSPLAETPGLYGSVGVTVPAIDVAASDGGACNTNNGDACRTIPVVTGFADGKIGAMTITNSNAVTDGGGPACMPFSIQATATNAHNLTTNNLFRAGTYQP